MQILDTLFGREEGGGVDDGMGALLSLATQDVIQPQQSPLSVLPSSTIRDESVMMTSVSFARC